MAWPTTPLAVTVEIAPGADLAAAPATWTWVNITAYVRVADRITITAGRPDEASTVESSTCTLTLDNRTGRFSPRNPLSPYYRQLARNTPLRVSVTPDGGSASVRFAGFVSEWPPRWDLSGKDATVPIRADGVLRRLAQGTPPKLTALARAALATSLLAAWPLSDGGASTQAASWVPGVPAMVASGTVSFGQDGPGGAGGAADMSGGGTLTAHTLPGGSSTGHRVEFWHKASPTDLGPVVWWTTSTGMVFELDITSAGFGEVDLQWSGYGSFGAEQVYPVQAIRDGGWHRYRVDMTQVGGDIRVVMTVDQSVIYDFTPFTGKTLGQVRSMRINPQPAQSSAAADDWSIAALMVWSPVPVGVDLYVAGTGYSGESPPTRISRVATDAGVPVTTTGTTSTTLGPQPEGGVLDIIYDAVAADMGLLYETAFGVGYVARSARYNPAVALTLSGHPLADPPEPVDDDQQLVNRLTVQRQGGSFGTYEDAASIAANGHYESSVTLSLADDGQCVPQAQWRVHLGTVDEARWPRLTWSLRARPALITAWLACGIGSRITVTSPPSDATPDPVDAILEGYTETLGPYDWYVEATTSPAQPWQVWTIQGAGNTGRLDAVGSTLAAGVTAVATTLSVATAAGHALWTTAAGDRPFDINVGGERMTVTNVTGATSPQTMTVTRSVNGVSKAQTSGTAVRLWRPSVIAL